MPVCLTLRSWMYPLAPTHSTAFYKPGELCLTCLPILTMTTIEQDKVWECQ